MSDHRPGPGASEAEKRGYEDGRDSSALDQFAHDLGKSIPLLPDNDYGKGFDKGVKDKK